MQQPPEINLYNKDCMEAMKAMPDNAYELAIVDPPYGLNDRLIKGGARGGMGSLQNLADSKVNYWDNNTPSISYFNELKRVSICQIIWGANYFLDYLGKTDGLIVWDKKNGTNPMADAEIAWQNFKKTTRMFRWHHFSGEKIKKIHPTQKPAKLYEWLLKNYANEGDKILDTHLGSGSIAIACHDLGFALDGFEIDEDYFQAAKQRLDTHRSQLQLF